MTDWASSEPRRAAESRPKDTAPDLASANFDALNVSLSSIKATEPPQREKHVIVDSFSKTNNSGCAALSIRACYTAGHARRGLTRAAGNMLNGFGPMFGTWVPNFLAEQQ